MGNVSVATLKHKIPELILRIKHPIQLYVGANEIKDDYMFCRDITDVVKVKANIGK